MIHVLLLCVLAQNAMTDDLNLTSREMAEAYRYFEAMHDAQNNPVTQTPPLKKILVPPKSNDLLTVLHSRSPRIPEVKPLEESEPVLESRESESSNVIEHKTNEDSNQKSTARPLIKDKIKILEEERMKFQQFLRQLFNENRLKPDNNKYNMSKFTKTQTTEAEKRRVFNWFKNLYGKKTVASTIEHSAKRPSEVTITDIAEVLDRLSIVLDKLNHNIEDAQLKTNKSDAYFVLKLPVKPKTDVNDIHYRRKREIKATINNAVNNTKIKGKQNYTGHNQTFTTKVPKVTKNQTGKPEVTENSFKSRVLAHLIDSFKEIKYKIAPLAKVKEDMSGYDLYKIGYIAASIDTLEENLNKLMKKIEGSQQDWEEKTILDIFDKLKTSNRVLRTLMQYLETLAMKKQVIEIKNLEEVAAS